MTPNHSMHAGLAMAKAPARQQTSRLAARQSNSRHRIGRRGGAWHPPALSGTMTWTHRGVEADTRVILRLCARLRQSASSRDESNFFSFSFSFYMWSTHECPHRFLYLYSLL